MTDTTMLYLWKKMPFCRLLVALTGGILLQVYVQFPFLPLLITGLVLLACLIAWHWLPIAVQFTSRWLQGALLLLLVSIAGAAVCWKNDIRHARQWYGHTYEPSMMVAATLEEPLVAKANSYKALARITALYVNSGWQPVTGQVLVYFRKSDSIPLLQYGSKILFRQSLQPINGNGNPGSFNYAHWCAFQNLYHQVFLQQKAYIVLPGLQRSSFRQWLYETRENILALLHRQVHDPQAAAVAGALLIGYKEELDKDIVASYTNTGVIHIIAISGLHLGLIYGLLIVVLGCFNRFTIVKWIRPLLLLTILWLFSFLAGAVPSILRSAVMFSFIVIGQASGKQHNIYNNLAASAFCLLVYDPFYLWDIGFQLSYSAVLGIVLFYKSVYHWLDFQNRLLKGAWQLLALSIAAQVLTLPVLLYRFHQFPNLFLISNFVAVPLSGLILYAEILLLTVSGIPSLASLAGKGIEALIHLLNSFIRYMAQFPFAVTDDIRLSGLETGLLYLFIICCCYGLLHGRRSTLRWSIGLLSAILLLQTGSLVQSRLQKRLVVYNIPRQTAVEFIHGRRSYFTGEEGLLQNKALQQNSLQPAHRLWGIVQTTLLLHQPITIVSYAGKRVAIVGEQPFMADSSDGLPVDILILCHNSKMPLSRLHTLFGCRQVVFDASNSLWKIEKWKKDCDSLHLRFHSVPHQGAFVMEF
jgi:competence protein ComEC